MGFARYVCIYHGGLDTYSIQIDSRYINHQLDVSQSLDISFLSPFYLSVSLYRLFCPVTRLSILPILSVLCIRLLKIHTTVVARNYQDLNKANLSHPQDP
jgi:hypothetical protein